VSGGACWGGGSSSRKPGTSLGEGAGLRKCLIVLCVGSLLLLLFVKGNGIIYDIMTADAMWGFE
jgi:hypothetical protein